MVIRKAVKKRILFVGSFKSSAKDGSVGGQMFACTTLVNSKIKDKADWILIDSTASTNIDRGLIKRSFSASLRLIKFIYTLLFTKIDLVIVFSANGTSFLEKGTMAIIASSFSKPVFFAPRAGLLMEELSKNNKMASFARKVFEASSVIICQSMIWKIYFQQFVDSKEKLVVIENWIDVKEYHFENSQHFETPTILFMSWVIKEKGIFELIEAIDTLNKENFKFQVLICGGGSELKVAQDLVADKSIDNIIFKGWVTGNDKLELFKKSHIYILPSYTEGFSNSLLEAMASGLAVITTPVGASVDIIENKKNGIFVDVKSSDDILNAVKFCLENPLLRKSIGQKAKEIVIKNNSIDPAVRSFSKLVDNF